MKICKRCSLKNAEGNVTSVLYIRWIVTPEITSDVPSDVELYDEKIV